jgi:tetraacyldisaccharide 4'-kinase
MVDAMDPFGGGRLLPRGRLREPVAALHRAHAIILSRTEQIPDLASLRRCLEQMVPGAVPVLTRHGPSRLSDLADGGERPLESLRGRRVLAMSGIANPGAFHRTLLDLGGVLAGTLVFPDHHAYGGADLARLDRAAMEAGADVIVTTEKDAIRMPAPEGAGMPCRRPVCSGWIGDSRGGRGARAAADAVWNRQQRAGMRPLLARDDRMGLAVDVDPLESAGSSCGW